MSDVGAGRNPMVPLSADRQQIESFVGALFRYADDGGFVQMRAFRDDIDGVWRPERWCAVPINGRGLGAVVNGAEALASDCAAAAERVVFAPPVATFKGAEGAAERDINNGLVLTVECDAAPETARKTLEALLGPATVIVASGGIWTDPATGEISDKLHLHWRLREPTREFPEHVRLKEARRLAMMLGGADGSAVPLCHPLRWPGTWHRKGEPRLAIIIVLNPDAEIELGDALDLLRDAVEVDGLAQKNEHKPGRGTSSDPQADPLDIAAALAVIPNNDLPWNEWNRLGMATWRASSGSEAGFAAFAAWSAKSSKNAPAETRARWLHYSSSPPTEIGIGTLFHMARQACPGWIKPSEYARRTTAHDTHTSTQQQQTPEDEWPDPEPLFSPSEAERPYPLHVLPPMIAEAVCEYQAYGQQPLSLVACSAMANTSLASQGLVDIARDEFLVGPISLNFLTIAISGERKTSADRTFNKALREWMSQRREALRPTADRAAAELAAWTAEREGLLLKIKRDAGKAGADAEADLSKIKDRLAVLESLRPEQVILPSLFYEDTNAARLAVDIAEGWPSASLWSDEAGLVIGSHGMSDDNLVGFLGLLNRLWDAQPFERRRLTMPSAIIDGRRLTVSLMMQPIILSQLLGAGGGVSRGMGFIARSLIAWPGSTIGLRPYREPNAMPKLDAFRVRLSELLEMALPVEGAGMVLRPPVLRLSPPAFRVWRLLHDEVEAELSRTGEFGAIPDIGAKIAENAARIAANFHVVEHGPGGGIGASHMEGAATVAIWHLNEARRVIGANDKPQDAADAELLLAWQLRQAETIDPREILNRGPNPLRKKERRDNALKVLIEKHWVFEVKDGRTTRLALNPKAMAAP